tara:strand:- start:74 stop:283 length:210 start_codon:yes stop_codon:yes gene_type:complete
MLSDFNGVTVMASNLGNALWIKNAKRMQVLTMGSLPASVMYVICYIITMVVRIASSLWFFRMTKKSWVS